MMKKKPLKEYHRKRNFLVTKEPAGKNKVSKTDSSLSFVIQEHHARRLHYDLRLEWEGVLKSWAVPKGPSLDPEDKRLAVRTEDHPLEYGKFKGTIPEGEYGAGEVFIWDKGIWVPEGDPSEGLRKGKLEFSLKGKKLKGRWVLVRTSFKNSEDRKNWLLIKRSDEVEGRIPTKKVKKKSSTKKKRQKKSLKLNDPWPGFVPPHLPRLISAPLNDNKYIHEIKLDGYRIQAHLKNGIAHFYTRNGVDWSNSFPHLLEGVGKLKAENAIMDGEIVALDKEGISSFHRLQNSFKKKRDKHLIYYVFDLLYLNGKDLRDRPLLERKKLLRNLLKESATKFHFSEHFFEKGEDLFDVSCIHRLEGIVSKHIDSPYKSGRNDLWAKTKCYLRQEFVVGGFSGPQGRRRGLGALLLGVYEDDKLRYVGKVGTGFTVSKLNELKKTLSQIERNDSPFDINSPDGRDIHWVRPERVVEVSFAEWTKALILRSPVFIALREDKSAKEIFMERSPNVLKHNRSSYPNIELSSPDKVLFKKEKITKKQVAEYYKVVSRYMLPLVADRPLSLVRCPDGTSGICFFQKHVPRPDNSSFKAFSIEGRNESGSGKGTYISLDSISGLMELIQMNAFEIHAWNCHRQGLMQPDQIVLDLDPGTGVPWKRVVKAAFQLKKLLSDLGLESFVKLTGGKGLHIHVPIAPIYDWEEIKVFSQALALELVAMNSRDFTTNMAKNKRKGKIFIDYLRNSYGATSVIPYSLRAKALSTVALPVSWQELKKITGGQQFTLEKTLRKLKRRRIDPWKGIEKKKQRIKILREMRKAS